MSAWRSERTAGRSVIATLTDCRSQRDDQTCFDAAWLLLAALKNPWLLNGNQNAGGDVTCFLILVRYRARMQEFESIRPYQDEEVEEVIARLVRDPGLRAAASRFLLPRISALAPAFANTLVGWMLRLRTRRMTTVEQVQVFLENYMRRLIETTVEDLSWSGLESLQPGTAYLFISNHRDIVLDSGILNYVIYHAGHQTARMAVGDNLLSEPFAADLMRLNKSFVVERSATGRKAIYQAINRTSSYIRHSLQTGHSVWIAQREGRAKDGFDRTDPALLKMLALAWRDDVEQFGEILENINLVPVSISYELDPCDRDKARELTLLERDGEYSKAADEDLNSIVRGLLGFKGRMHLHFSDPIKADVADADELAKLVDRAIVAGLTVFPTQAAAARELGMTHIPEAGSWPVKVQQAYAQRLETCPPDYRPALLASYGNLIRNRNELGVNADS